MNDDIKRSPCPSCGGVRVRKLETLGAIFYHCQACSHEWSVEKS